MVFVLSHPFVFVEKLTVTSLFVQLQFDVIFDIVVVGAVVSTVTTLLHVVAA